MLLDGKTRGRIWANHADTPTTALVWDQVNTLFFLLGDCAGDEFKQSINRLIIETIFPAAIQLGYRKFYLQCAPHSEWQGQIDVILAGSIPEQQSIYSYTLEPKHTGVHLTWELGFPPGFELARITPDIINNSDRKNQNELVYDIRACWGSTDQYLDHGGIGFCLLQEDEIASWCSTDYVIPAACELYVETFQGYQQKGLGTLVAKACIRECLARDLAVHWHCFQYAIGSVKIAEKLDLVKTADCPVYIVDLQATQT